MSGSEPDISPAPFITFYSFKGGVGRSMALINVAGIMAGRGFRVLALDMDLEAPGISYLMRHEAQLRSELLPGITDLLSDAVLRGDQADLFKMTPSAVIEKYSYPYSVPNGIREKADGCLRIMPAGKFDGHYQERLDDLNLGGLYRAGLGEPLVRNFKKTVLATGSFDFVLVDSRTGFSDESGICTRDLADHLIVVMGFNHQNLEGTAEFLRALHRSPTSTKKVQIVLSPAPTGEDDLVDQRELEIGKRLKDAWGQELSLSLSIPYHPRLALTEEPHIFRRSRGHLYDAYVAIHESLLAQLGHTAREFAQRAEKAINESRVGDAMWFLDRLLKFRGSGSALDRVAASFQGIKSPDKLQPIIAFLAENLSAESRMLRVLADILTAMKSEQAQLFWKRMLQEDPRNSAALLGYGRFLVGVSKDSLHAESFFLQAIEIAPKDVNACVAVALFYGNDRGDYDKAEPYYRRALALAPNEANIHGNLAQALFILGKTEEALQQVREARQFATQEEGALLCELDFYEYAHEPQKFPESLSHLKRRLLNGARSRDWHLEANVAVAKKAGHYDWELVAQLAKVIPGTDEIDSLDSFEVWRSTSHVGKARARKWVPSPNPTSQRKSKKG